MDATKTDAKLYEVETGKRFAGKHVQAAITTHDKVFAVALYGILTTFTLGTEEADNIGGDFHDNDGVFTIESDCITPKALKTVLAQATAIADACRANGVTL